MTFSASPTPYDGSSKPFVIGLKPLDASAWIEVDGDLLPMLAEKARLLGSILPDVFVEEPDTRAAQAELRDKLADYLVQHYPHRFRIDRDDMLIDGGARRVHLTEEAMPPLLAAASLIAEDLVLMRKDGTGWRLVAASLCFPSSWTLSEKFGRPLQEIHNPVPGFGEGTRTAEVIQRIFDNLQPNQPVIRWNWSLQSDRALYKPLSNVQRDVRADAPARRFPAGIASAFIRVERQTLMRLPVSGDIVFTIRIFLDPLATIARHPDRAKIAASLAGQLDALDTAQLAYKGFTADRDALAAELRALAGTARV